MGGADTWNEDLREYENRQQMLAALATDRYGIAYTAMAYATAGVKALALAESAAGPYVQPSRATVANRSYPLSRSAYIYLAPDTATGDRAKMEPKLREFLRYILSAEGQTEVAREGDYLPLTGDILRKQREKLQ
jgi:phosphate transport system substrate-binding protein